MRKKSIINFELLESRWMTKYPNSFLLFKNELNSKATLEILLSFFQSKHIQIQFSETTALNKNYSGTFSFKVTINSIPIVEKLGRTKKHFSYYGLSTLENAITKGLNKSFEILECLLTEKKLPEAKRKQRVK